MALPRSDDRAVYEPVADEEPSVAEALERVYEAGQGLLVRRLELLFEQGRDLLAATLTAQAGAVFALAGWALILAGALLGLDEGAPRRIGIFAVGAAHLLGGVLIVRRGLQEAKQSARAEKEPK